MTLSCQFEPQSPKLYGTPKFETYFLGQSWCSKSIYKKMLLGTFSATTRALLKTKLFRRVVFYCLKFFQIVCQIINKVAFSRL